MIIVLLLFAQLGLAVLNCLPQRIQSHRIVSQAWLATILLLIAAVWPLLT